jgi:Tfp pilus assembly protein PilX
MTVRTGGGLVATNGALPGDVNYAASPSFHIAWLGSTTGGANIYQITSGAVGGSSNSASVVQSIYVVSTGARCGDCP